MIVYLIGVIVAMFLHSLIMSVNGNNRAFISKIGANTSSLVVIGITSWLGAILLLVVLLYTIHELNSKEKS